jgi:hypothetical protein
MPSEIVLVVSNAFAVVLFALALYRPNAARKIAGAGFIAASAVNCWFGLRDPQAYVRGFGPHAVSVYHDFIVSAFAKNPAGLVLPIAACQLVMGALVLTRDPWVKLGLVAMIEFLIAITPLGRGSGFPAPLLMAATMAVLCFKKWPPPEEISNPDPQVTMEACGR